MTSSSRAAVLIWVVSIALWAAEDNQAIVAYSHDGVLRIATQSGRRLRTIQATPQIGDFAISPDGETVVFSPPGADYGGPLYILSVSSGHAHLLVQDRYYVRGEVYSDPDFSPSGEAVVFAIHGRPKGDLVEASGPFATVDIDTKEVRVLPSTMNIEGGGVAFANDPRWSPDGKKLLLNFESDAGVADATGKSLEMLSSLLPTGEKAWIHGLGWIGNRCVLYISGTDQHTADRTPARVVSTDTRKSVPANVLLNGSAESFTELRAFSMPVRVREVDGNLMVEGVPAPWRIPASASHTVVRLVHQPKNDIPTGCR